MTTPTCAELQAWLTEAEAALRDARLGRRVTVMQYGTKRVEYAATNMADLARYVDELRNSVATCTGAPRLVRRRFGVIPS